MDFQIIPVAEANISTLMKSIDRVILNPIIFFLFAVAMVYFLYGLAQYLLSPDNEEIRKKSKSHMLWGVIGLFIMVAVFGIMRIILNTIGENKIQINSNGDFNVSGTNVEDQNINDGTSTGQDLFKTDNSINASTPNNSPTNVAKPEVNSYTTSPFTKHYIPNALCWRKELYSHESTEYKALQSIKTIARTQFLFDNGLLDKNTDPSLPTAYGVMSAYDKDTKTYYVWWDARAPINGGKDSDCNLVEAQ